jgi:hypothetical protein
MPNFVSPEIAATKYEHGSYARYSLAKCRCFPCKVANADYVHNIAEPRRLPYRVRFARMTREFWVQRLADGACVLKTPDRAAAYRRRDQLNGPFKNRDDRERVPAAKARRHILKLKKTVGTRVIAARAGVSRSCIQHILSGEFATLRRATSDAILGVVADTVPGSYVDASPTWKLIAEILATGKSQAWIAQQLGAKSRALQIRKGACRRSTANRVRELHARIFAPPPAPPTPPTPQRKLADALRRMDVDEFATRLSRLGDLRRDGSSQ